MRTAVDSQVRGEPKIDIHVHLAGVGTGRSGCWMSPAFRRRPTFVGLRMLLGISGRQLETSIDQDWAALLSALTAQSEMDYSVALGFDGVYDTGGRLNEACSQLIVPPGWVFEVCGRYSNLLPAPSINPYRRDALDLLDESIERGAVMIKWLPLVQGFDPASHRARPFLRRLAESGIPLLIHAGSGEVTFRTIDAEVGDLSRLEVGLELGVSIICAHAAAPIHHRREPSQLPLARQYLERYPHFWLDNSGMSNPSRCFHLARIANDSFLRDRILHGSDFPVPCDALYYPGRLPLKSIRKIQAERNRLQRDVLIKRGLGFGEASFTRAANVLANLDRWTTGKRSSLPE